MSYQSNQILSYRDKNPITVICDQCLSSFQVLYKSAEKNRKRNGKHICSKCKGYTLRPQQGKSYWTDEKKLTHSSSVKLSDKYKKSVLTRDIAGSKNGMYGKTHTKTTIQKMRKSRIGKIGVNATAWKGGKTSVNCRVKKIIHTRYNWYFRVYQRDSFKCAKCGSKKEIDAHHIEPISLIIKRLLGEKQFLNDDEKVLYLTDHPDIIDIELKNGITLCRECHKDVHDNWGSHVAKSK